MKRAWAIFFSYFLKNKVLKNFTLILLRGIQWTPTLIFLGVGHRETKSNRWVERSPKIRNLRRCYSLQKFSKHEKRTITYRLGSDRSHPPTPLPHPSVSRGFNQMCDAWRVNKMRELLLKNHYKKNRFSEVIAETTGL